MTCDIMEIEVSAIWTYGFKFNELLFRFHFLHSIYHLLFYCTHFTSLVLLSFFIIGVYFLISMLIADITNPACSCRSSEISLTSPASSHVIIEAIIDLWLDSVDLFHFASLIVSLHSSISL